MPKCFTLTFPVETRFELPGPLPVIAFPSGQPVQLYGEGVAILFPAGAGIEFPPNPMKVEIPGGNGPIELDPNEGDDKVVVTLPNGDQSAFDLSGTPGLLLTGIPNLIPPLVLLPPGATVTPAGQPPFELPQPANLGVRAPTRLIPAIPVPTPPPPVA